jgi:glutathione peroxidase-family protein
MFTVVELNCNRFVEQDLSLEEIQEFCRRHTNMMSGFMPEDMGEVRQRVAMYQIALENYNPELIHWQNRE